MDQVKVYTCFIASPSDTSEERDICDIIFKEINEGQGKRGGFRVESKKWEKNAVPGFGDYPQQVLNNDIVKDFDIFIGIMYSRFGTETKNAGSGTQEEFNLAYKNKEQIKIMFYFNQEKIDQNQIDLDQYKKVIDFKNSLGELGGLYWNYCGSEDFGKQLKKHLESHFYALLKDFEDKPKNNHVENILQARLDESLSTFSNQPNIWVNPKLFVDNGISENSKDEDREEVFVVDIIDKPYSAIIKAPPQFGLTCLSHYLVLSAWKKNKIWVYLNLDQINIHIEIEKIVNREINIFGVKDGKIDCIVLDAWSPTKTGSKKIIRNLCNKFSDIPILIMNTMGEFKRKEESDIKIDRKFKELSLSALSRKSMREVVSAYNSKRYIGDENVILEKVAKDIEALNIHRTPLNCITLLKISEKHFNESPVNRTKMIEMFLFVLFDLVELPTYKTKPDVKDCEHVLGYFCEILIRRGVYSFSKEEFVKMLGNFCSSNLLDLEVVVVFDVLLENRIIIASDSAYRFRAVYWVYYFAAIQMHADSEFYSFILSEEQYINFPEIVEFYTGIDRKSVEIIRVLTSDLSKQCDIVENKTGITSDFNPIGAFKWSPDKKHIEEAKKLICDEVLGSNLPDSIKDEYADKSYDYEKPYNQEILNILDSFTFLVLKQKINACSRALRNSDYVDAELKVSLLKEITRGWSLFSKILFAMAPALAKYEYASFDGLGFYLCGFHQKEIDEKIKAILLNTPNFVVRLFKDDLFSPKGAPLLYKTYSEESDHLKKHELILVMIYGRPKEWKKHLKNYIESLPKDSPYLFDVLALLKNRIRYDFAENSEIMDMSELLKMCYAKHEYGGNNLTDKIKKIPNRLVPKREVED